MAGSVIPNLLGNVHVADPRTRFGADIDDLIFNRQNVDVASTHLFGLFLTVKTKTINLCGLDMHGWKRHTQFIGECACS
jgi:hypothetical protein